MSSSKTESPLEQALATAVRGTALDGGAIQAVSLFLAPEREASRREDTASLRILGEWLFERRLMKELPDDVTDQLWVELAPIIVAAVDTEPSPASPIGRLLTECRRRVARGLRSASCGVYDRALLQSEESGSSGNTNIIGLGWLRNVLQSSTALDEQKRVRSVISGGVLGRGGLRDLRFNPHAVD